ncbi:Tripartite-type tricarboxylate transporter, receptor component TctC [Enhydrobacter aerosaccus]|uniref:Tripartite-type tricarboxylate transporter, receptor component TctC n=1 Tax=Enhydrobacter aerosaccus TaxID=225324 RepID=A0A1T4T8U8_9HYPH|nr:tripartite tricarboxylate transporter substrate binding protein [Enhydrobacter aerosaccus]SKA36846.1 Tripartite-type tricarboxylate transporter, receptor component TctC [Enhydrobacter aerosaccus]
MRLASRRGFVVGSLASLASAASVRADSFPSQPIHMVVPFPPGGGTDALARAIQEPLQKALGQSIIIENRGGGGGNLGHEIVAKAAPDGYTVLVSSNNQMLYPFLVAHLGFDPAAFVPIGFIAKQESVFVGSADAPWKDLAEITEAARKAPGEVQYGTAGVSTPMHLSTERYAILNKISLTHVPFRGTGPLVTDLLGGHVKLGMSSLTSVAQYLSSGRLKPYGMAAPERAQSEPNIKTFKEQGFGDVDGTIVYTLIAPPKTPPAVVARLNEALNEAVATPAMREDLRQRGFVAMGGTPEELATWTAVQAPLWGPVLQAAGIKPE